MNTDNAIWLHRLTPSELAYARSSRGNEAVRPSPLAGLTFAIKDNIDLAGIPTTAACPGFAYTPVESATVVARLLAAGALPLGKTNLDQFATGLVGTRSPHGAPRCVFNSEYISGGSSSGSAVAVAAGLVDFALGTDTAGSGRVPAAFNGIIGLKPTKGRLSTRGVVPACRSLDCVSIFARDLTVTARVLAAAEGFDPADHFSSPKPKCHLLGDTLVWVKTVLRMKRPCQEVSVWRRKPAACRRSLAGGRARTARPVCHRKNACIKASQTRARRRRTPDGGKAKSA